MPLGIASFCGIVITAASAQGPQFCGTCFNSGPPPDMVETTLTLTCDEPGATISALPFVAYGEPSGSCGAYDRGCDSATAPSVVNSSCLGLHSCSIAPSTANFGDPCVGQWKVLTVQATCTTGTGSALCNWTSPGLSLIHI